MNNEDMLLVPGPTPVIEPIYEALSSETRSHTDPRFVSIFKKAVEDSKKLFNTDGEVFILAGSGTLAMEMALVNTVTRGEKILIISQGFFGDRFVKLAEAFGIEVDLLQSEWGERISVSEVKDKLSKENYKAVTITHVDTSTGVSADLDTLIPLVKSHGALAIVDGVCATAALEENMGKQYGNHKIDIVLTGSQKAIGIPPGLAIVAFNKTALEARKNIPQVPAYYCDINNWLPIMNNPSKYFATPPVNLIMAYEKGLQLIFEEGLEQRYERHSKFGQATRAALSSYDMKPLAAEDVAAATLSCILYPDGVDDEKFRNSLAEKGVIVAGGLAHLSGKAFRIGHMGNTRKDMLEKAVQLIGETLIEQGLQVDINKANKIFNSFF